MSTAGARLRDGLPVRVRPQVRVDLRRRHDQRGKEDHIRVADRHVSRQLLARVLQPVPESERSVGVLVRGEGGRELGDEVRARRRLEDRLPRSEPLGFAVASGDEARDLAGVADGECGVDEEERLPARDAN